MSTRRPNVPRAAKPAVTGHRSVAVPPKRPGSQGASAHAPGAKTSAKNPVKVPSKGAAKGPAKAAPKTQEKPGVQAAAKSTPSEARAAERLQLAGAIRRAKAPFRKDAGRAIVPAEDAQPIPAKSFSGRLLALAVVLITMTVLLAPSVRTYLLQQGELNTLRDSIAQQEQQQTDLETQIERWEDPSFIKQQARDRLFLVMPGEKRYLVKGSEGLAPSDAPGSSDAPQDLPWVDALWNSVERAATDS